MPYHSNQIAEFCGVNQATVSNWTRNGALKGKRNKETNFWEYEKQDVVNFLITHKRYLEHFQKHTPSAVYKVSYEMLASMLESETIRLYSARTIASVLGYSMQDVLRMLRSGELPGFKASGQWTVAESDFIRFLQGHIRCYYRLYHCKPEGEIAVQARKDIIRAFRKAAIKEVEE